MPLKFGKYKRIKKFATLKRAEQWFVCHNCAFNGFQNMSVSENEADAHIDDGHNMPDFKKKFDVENSVDEPSELDF